MADKSEPKTLLTQDLEVPPGVVLTPDYEVQPAPAPGRPRYADRRIDAAGNVLHPVQEGAYDHLSTYGMSAKEAARAAAAVATPGAATAEHSALAAQQQ